MMQRLSDDCQFQCTDPILRCHICATDMHEKHLTEQLHYVTPQQRWDHSLFGHSWRHWWPIFLLQRKNANEEPARARTWQWWKTSCHNGKVSCIIVVFCLQMHDQKPDFLRTTFRSLTSCSSSLHVLAHLWRRHIFHWQSTSFHINLNSLATLTLRHLRSTYTSSQE